MLIFVSGHRPIYGRQMLYFFDPILHFRAQIPPPQQFHCIRNGAEIPQDPLVRPFPPLVRPTPPSSPRSRKGKVDLPDPQELQPSLGFVERLKE
jgi:type IV secretion system protein VirD4